MLNSSRKYSAMNSPRSSMAQVSFQGMSFLPHANLLPIIPVCCVTYLPGLDPRALSHKGRGVKEHVNVCLSVHFGHFRCGSAMTDNRAMNGLGPPRPRRAYAIGPQ